MKRTTRRTVLLLAVLLLLGLSLFFRTSALSPGDAASTGFYARQGLIPARPQPSAAPAAEPTGEPAPAETEAPAAEVRDFVISVIGDNTLASHQFAGASVSFAGRMKDDYAYPYSNTVQYFKNDDFTISNLECTLSDRKLSSAEQWYFLAPTAYANILLEGGVDFVTTANNHMEDFGQKGVDDTYAALEEYGIPYGKEGEARLITTDSGLVLGIYCDYNHLNPDAEKSAAAVRQLRADGAEYVICAFHWGKELYYSPNDDQIALAHACIDAGADLIYGSHTHNLQPIEQYGKGLILYSMGNWSFGGSTAPSDRDTAIVQVRLHRDESGKVGTAGYEVIPCCVSSRPVLEDYQRDGYNDYRPTPYVEGTEAYERALSKIDGSYTGADMQRANFTNCIVYGSRSAEVAISTMPPFAMHYAFDHCLVRGGEWDEDPLFEDVDEDNYRPKDNSPAKGIGYQY